MTTELSSGSGCDLEDGKSGVDNMTSATSTFASTASLTGRSISAPSSSTRLYMSSSSSSSASDGAGGAASTATTAIQKVIPEVHPDNPYLYQLPKELHRYYGALPLFVKVLSVLTATWIAAASSFARITWWQPLSVARGGLRPMTPSWSRLALFLVKAVTYSLLSQAVLQEMIAAPSRVSMETLLQRYFLPSKLSRYQTVSVPQALSSGSGQQQQQEEEASPFSLGVHYLKYDNLRYMTSKGGGTGDGEDDETKP
ncbi:MAG: hypothetical protein SGARI_006631, partial [Bacillariaceae sp.]